MNHAQQYQEYEAQVAKGFAILKAWNEALAHGAQQHPEDGQKGGDLPAEEISQKTQRQPTEGPREEGNGETQPSCHGGALEEVLLKVGLQEAKKTELIPLQDVPEKQ